MNEQNQDIQQNLKMQIKNDKKEDIKKSEEKDLPIRHSENTEQDVKSLKEQITQIQHDLSALKGSVENIYELIKNDDGRLLANQSPQKKDSNNVTFRDIQNATDVQAHNQQGSRNSVTPDHNSLTNQHVNHYSKMMGSYWESNETLENSDLKKKEIKDNYNISEDINDPAENQNNRGNRFLSLFKWKD